ncbi:MAG: hypothetical protein AVO33_07765 [delta proteobacterium ML8_F1]|nr:MAG: hypothetical protein AVO33_07765 [delta proteobacterium ML8_F1]
MFIEAIFVGLVIVFLTNGRFDNFSEVEIKGWPMIVAGVILELSVIFFSRYTFSLYLQLTGMMTVMLAVAMNLRIRGFLLMFLGGLLNLMAVLLNNLRMPVNLVGGKTSSMTSFMDTVLEGDVINYMVDSAGGWTALLGKIMTTPIWYPFPRLLSVGDLVITLGILFFIVGESKRKHFHRESTMVQYSYRNRI